jgi:class 3 adenylate cyclase
MSGNVGSARQLEYTVHGDTVNTAARVEEATRETGDVVLVTEATRRLLEADHGGFIPRGRVPLKGKAEHVQLYAPVAATVLREAEDVGDFEAWRRR